MLVADDGSTVWALTKRSAAVPHLTRLAKPIPGAPPSRPPARCTLFRPALHNRQFAWTLAAAALLLPVLLAYPPNWLAWPLCVASAGLLIAAGVLVQRRGAYAPDGAWTVRAPEPGSAPPPLRGKVNWALPMASLATVANTVLKGQDLWSGTAVLTVWAATMAIWAALTRPPAIP